MREDSLAWQELFPHYEIGAKSMTVRKRNELVTRKHCELVIASYEKKTEGGWVIQNCDKLGCTKQVCYWSASGVRLLKYDGAVCDMHK